MVAGGKLVGSRWTSGNLEFLDTNGTVIGTIDGTNGLFKFAQSRSVLIPLSTFRELASDDIPAVAIASGGSGIMGKDSTPNFEAVNGATDRAQQLQWAASNVDKISVTVMLPVDLDGTKTMTVQMVAGKTGTMDTVAMSVSAWFDRGDTELTGTTSNLANGTGAAVTGVTLAAADVSDTPGQLTVVIFPGTHANDTVELYGVRLDYTSKAA
jgi:hypothetical protein